MTNNEMILSLKSDTFAAMKEDFDGVLARTIGNMEMKNADNATITLKLGITLDKVSVGTPNGNQDITRPSFKHDISSVMQVKDRKSGALTGDYELVYEDGKYVMRRIDDGQTDMFGSNVEHVEASFVDADYTDVDDDTDRQKAIPAASEVGPRKLPAASADASEDDPEDGDYTYDEPED